MGIFSIPNSLSLSRILILVPFVYAALNRNVVLASFLLLVSASTDVADGFTARRLNQVTRFGAILDASVDKIHAVVVLVSLSVTGLFPVWATVLIVAREAVIVGGGLDLMRRGREILPPTFEGRFTRLMLLLMEISYLIGFSPFNLVLLFGVLVLMSISLVDYSRLYARAIGEGKPARLTN